MPYEPSEILGESKSALKWGLLRRFIAHASQRAVARAQSGGAGSSSSKGAGAELPGVIVAAVSSNISRKKTPS